MKTTLLARRNIAFKPLTPVFNVLILACGIAAIIAITHLKAQIGDRFTRDIAGIDMVIGAKGSPLQIILSGIFHIDTPTGNIPLAAVDNIRSHHLVRKTIPLALGDNYRGFRIVGTDDTYPALYNAAAARGAIRLATAQAVIGATVAKETGLSVGDNFSGAHGLAAGGHAHDDHPYHVTGVLKPTGTVIDRLILTTIESIWHAHEDKDGHKHHHDRDITALLVFYKSPLATATLPRTVNADPHLQAASPAFETARLLRLTGNGFALMRGFAVLITCFAAIGIFTAFYTATTERAGDIALMRFMGARPARICLILLTEALILGAAAAVAGVIMAHGVLAGLRGWIAATHHIALLPVRPDGVDLAVCLAGVALAVLAALLPALRAGRTDVATILARQ